MAGFLRAHSSGWRVDEVIPFPLAKVQGGDPGRVLHEADDGEFSLLNSFNFQPCFVPVGSVRRVGVLRDDAFPVQLGSMFKYLLPVAEKTSLSCRPAASSAWSSEKFVRPSLMTTTSPSMIA
jgi:hypothetical protein